MSSVFIAVFGVAVSVAVIQQFFNHSRRSQRLVYWSCTCIAAVAGFMAVHPDPKKGIQFALFALAMMVGIAWAYTPYIKIRGRIYALTVHDSQPDPDENDDDNLDVAAEGASDGQAPDPAPDAYSGLLTTTKMWWLLVAISGISSINIYAYLTGEGEAWVAAIGLAFLVFLGIATGYGDASWEYRIARGQYLQFGISTVITAGAFAVLYLMAYQTALRLPLRRKQSMEYRAHPRHRELD
jgi:hypothetical protein